MNCELLDLRAFLAVLDLGSFNKAAQQLNLSQPALSRRIQSLEAALGVPLLERTTRHVAPTAVGREVEPLVRRLLDEFESSILSTTMVGSRQRGQVTLACIPTAAFYFLPRVIQAFQEQYPLIRFRILDESANEGLESVARGEAEFGINLVGASSDELVFTPLLDDPFVLACRHDHPFAKRERLTWRDLEDHPLIGVSRTSGNRLLLDAMLSKEMLKLNWRHEVNHLSTSVGSSTVNMPAILSAATATDICRRAGCIGPWRPRARPAGSFRTSGSASQANPLGQARPGRGVVGRHPR
jgi:DNA-binding transcriptional LysR family regulator